MTQKIKASELPDFDVTELLDTDEDIAAYLAIAMDENDPNELTLALHDAARAYGINQMAKATGVSRQALIHAPASIDLIAQVCQALGLRSVQHA